MHTLDDFYVDDKCRKCGLERTPEGHDPCIANLPGVKYACCGHGLQEGYVCFENGVVVRSEIETSLLDKSIVRWRELQRLIDTGASKEEILACANSEWNDDTLIPTTQSDNFPV